MKTFIALSGLPRTGSTLLSAILSQNPKIHAEGNSAVCQLAWDLQNSIQNSEQIFANNKNVQNELIQQIPKIYYKTKKPIIVDKCRSWTLPANMEILRRYFNDDPKVIVLVRPIEEIVKSFISLRKANGWEDLEKGLLDDGSEPIMRSLAGVEWAKKNNNGEFLFIEYKQLIDQTQTTLKKIYDFCNWPYFNHDLINIKNLQEENDLFYNLKGQHEIRPLIGRRFLDVKMSKEIIKKCQDLDEWSKNDAILCASR